MNMRSVCPQSHALIALRDCDHPVNAPDTDSLDLAGLEPLPIAGRDLFQGPRLRRLARSHAAVARLKHDGSAADDEKAPERAFAHFGRAPSFRLPPVDL
jgi:hypothetical protein